jgi:acyl-coenzyme A thioesterase PaaI-like protein
MALSLQEQYAPESACFGCGPANAKGLHVRSFLAGEELVCDWTPEPHHHAFDDVLNGGIVGTLLDCHCNWAGAYALMRAAGSERVPGTVTSEYAISLKRPTPMAPLKLRARVVELAPPRAIVFGTLEAEGKVTATCRGTFVAVGPGHPAYQRW